MDHIHSILTLTFFEIPTFCQTCPSAQMIDLVASFQNPPKFCGPPTFELSTTTEPPLTLTPLISIMSSSVPVQVSAAFGHACFPYWPQPCGCHGIFGMLPKMSALPDDPTSFIVRVQPLVVSLKRPSKTLEPTQPGKSDFDGLVKAFFVETCSSQQLESLRWRHCRPTVGWLSLLQGANLS
mmetsp:Transcript_81084/g.262060  ORF Transcript_81084/g.262060 Transcript_81084/m.262060 type:complete len:181 (-) Transcript_81084:986-1528(-)